MTLLYQYYMLMRRLYIPLQLRSSVTQLGTTSQAHLVDHCYSLAPGPIASRPATDGDRVLNGNFLGSLNGGTLVPYFKPYLERNITIYCLTWPEMQFFFPSSSLEFRYAKGEGKQPPNQIPLLQVVCFFGCFLATRGFAGHDM